MALIQRTVCSCDVCGHEWIPERRGVEPKRCPSRKCRSAVWNRNQDGIAKEPELAADQELSIEEQVWS